MMKKVFISGSMRIKNLNTNVLSAIDNILNGDPQVIIGDANGVDSSIQEYLTTKQYKSVVIYCSGNQARNNVGHWLIKEISTKQKPGTRAFFTEKDIKMAEDCDYGFMVWDTKSIGTLSNIIELLKRKKSSLIYINKLKELLTINEVSDFEKLISSMSESARSKAESELGLISTIISLKSLQFQCDKK
jgi:hypothetical protein